MTDNIPVEKASRLGIDGCGKDCGFFDCGEEHRGNKFLCAKCSCMSSCASKEEKE